MSLTSAEKAAYDGWKTKATRLETERNNLRALLNETNADARSMKAQLDGIEDTLRFVTERAERLASADPTEPGRTGERLAPRFVEWMMGAPEGHITGVPGIPRNAQLKAAGNGVVRQQGAEALRRLLARREAAHA